MGTLPLPFLYFVSTLIFLDGFDNDNNNNKKKKITFRWIASTVDAQVDKK